MSFSSSSEVFMVDGWWKSGYGKVRGVRGDQMRGLNIRVWVGERRRRRRWWKKRGKKVRLS